VTAHHSLSFLLIDLMLSYCSTSPHSKTGAWEELMRQEISEIITLIDFSYMTTILEKKLEKTAKFG
jgi:hypothetical protein